MNNTPLSPEKEKEHVAPNAAFEFLQKNAVTLSGVGGVIGYSALMMDGILRGDKTLALTGIAALSPIILAVCGNGDKSASIERMESQMRDHLVQQGFEIPEAGFKKEEAQGLGVAWQMMKEHPVELSYAAMFLGTTFLWAAGFKEFQEKGDITKLATATTTLIGSAIVATIPEKSPLAKEDGKDKGFFGGIYDFVQKNTLPIFAGLNTVDVVCWTKEMLDDSFEKPLPLLGNFYKHGRDNKVEELGKNVTELQNAINEQYDELRKATTASAESGIHKKLESLKGQVASSEEGIAYLNNPKELPFVNMTRADASGILKAVVTVGLSTQILLNFVAHKNKSPEEMLAEYEKAFVTTAKMLQHIPEEDREVALQQMVTFMSVDKTMKDACMEPLEIKAAIEKQVALLNESPAVETQKEAANSVVSTAKLKGRLETKEASLAVV